MSLFFDYHKSEAIAPKIIGIYMAVYIPILIIMVETGIETKVMFPLQRY
jgi:hypothetical protein